MEAGDAKSYGTVAVQRVTMAPGKNQKEQKQNPCRPWNLISPLDSTSVDRL